MTQRQEYNGLVERHDKLIDVGREERLAAHKARVEEEMAADAKAEAATAATKKVEKTSRMPEIRAATIRRSVRSR